MLIFYQVLGQKACKYTNYFTTCYVSLRVRPRRNERIGHITCGNNYSIRGQTFFGHYSVIFWELKKLLSIDCCCEINVIALNFRFLRPFLRESGHGRRLRVWGLKTQPKSSSSLESF